MRKILRPLLFLAALLFLAEAWLWERLSPIVGWIVGHVFWTRIRVSVAAAIERLPPYGTLVVFAVPVLLLLPFKLSAFWLLAHGHWILGGGIFLLAKIVGLAVTAYLFETCKPKLLLIGWFSKFYALMSRWLLRAREIVEPYKQGVRDYAAQIRRLLPYSTRTGFAGRALSRLRFRSRRAGPS